MRAAQVPPLLFRALFVGALLAALPGCGGSAGARAPASELKVAASALRLEVIDHRPAPVGDRRLVLELPADFQARAQERLDVRRQGEGDALDVRAVVAAAQATEIVDARGEMTRIEVSLDFETRVVDGPLLKRGRGHAQEDIPRAEADDAEVARVLATTALDAVDRYWGSEETLVGLNRELAAYRSRRRSD
jgi:hypothetical protein